jgi:hypothetical protein
MMGPLLPNTGNSICDDRYEDEDEPLDYDEQEDDDE